MYRIRPVMEKDVDPIHVLANASGFGLTSLPKNKISLSSEIQKGVLSFKQEVDHPFYLFVLEDMATSEVLGTSAIRKNTFNLTYYRMEEIPQPPLFPEVPPYMISLNRMNYLKGPSEICALFLTPKARKEGLGKLLSLCRFHFIAAHLKRFTKQIFAILRGRIDSSGQSPFWEAVGRHFFPVPFKKLMEFREIEDTIILKLMPKFPLYLDMLPEEAKEAVGKPHTEGKAALEMLLKQGFKLTGEVDIYEGGPRVIADVTKIKTIQESMTFKIQSIQNNIKSPSVLVSNQKLHFHACYGKVDEIHGAIDPATAKALEVKEGDLVRWSP